MYFVLEYVPVAGSTFCAVPVFPAAEYPSRIALRPVPSSTTFCIMDRISAAVYEEITRCWLAGRNVIVCGTVFGSACGGSVPATMRGATHTPSLANVEIRPVSCNGEMPISCPMEIAAIDTFDQRLTGFVSPRVSPGNSIPVCCPNPYARMYL